MTRDSCLRKTQSVFGFETHRHIGHIVYAAFAAKQKSMCPMCLCVSKNVFCVDVNILEKKFFKKNLEHNVGLLESDRSLFQISKIQIKQSPRN